MVIRETTAFFNHKGTCPTSYSHILAVKMSELDTFEERIRGPFAKLKALSTPVMPYFIMRTSKGSQLSDTVLTSVLKKSISYFPIPKFLGVSKILSQKTVQ